MILIDLLCSKLVYIYFCHRRAIKIASYSWTLILRLQYGI